MGVYPRVPHVQVPAIVLANVCVSYIMTSQNEEAEELMKKIEKEEERAAYEGSAQGRHPRGAQGGPESKSFHLCIVNLVIGTLYCSKGVPGPDLAHFRPHILGLYYHYPLPVASCSLPIAHSPPITQYSPPIPILSPVPICHPSFLHHIPPPYSTSMHLMAGQVTTSSVYRG